MQLQHHAAKLIMKIGPLPDAVEPDFQCVRTHWIRGFMAFWLVRRIRAVMLMVLAWPESGFREGVARLRPLTKRARTEGSTPFSGVAGR
jgi:hypothetical protein